MAKIVVFAAALFITYLIGYYVATKDYENRIDSAIRKIERELKELETQGNGKEN